MLINNYGVYRRELKTWHQAKKYNTNKPFGFIYMFICPLLDFSMQDKVLKKLLEELWYVLPSSPLKPWSFGLVAVLFSSTATTCSSCCQVSIALFKLNVITLKPAMKKNAVNRIGGPVKHAVYSHLLTKF